MKKLIMLISLFIVLSACKKDAETNPDNFMNGSTWEAPDDLGTLIYGSTVSVLEFLDNENFQEISVTYGDVRKTVHGTFTVSESLVKMTYDPNTDGVSRKMQGTVSGSVMTTDMGTIAGGKRVYQKE